MAGPASGSKPATRRIDIGEQSKRDRAVFPGNGVSTTNYKLWNIIPANMFEQFHRVANVWFLLVSIFQMLPLDISPTSQYATLVPLCCVLFVTFCKDAYEDYRRWGDDCRVNSQTVEVVGRALSVEVAEKRAVEEEPFQRIRWSDVTVGMYIRLARDEPVPADCMVLCTSHSDGLAYVDTAQLDGETSLKAKYAPEETMHLIQTMDLSLIEGHVEAEMPNEFVQSFTGILHLKGKPRGTPLDLKNVVLRGSTIRNTSWVLGLVVYTGCDTKVVRNSNRTLIAKRSQVEVTANRLLIIVFCILAVVSITSAAARATGGFTSNGRLARQLEWVWPEIDNVKDNPYLSVLTFLIGYNNIIPISLYVTTDCVRAMQAFLMQQDSSMYHKDTDSYCKVRSSGLCEDLGQVEFVMSDKTGTLTQNLMCFKACYFNGQTYGYWDPEGQSDPRDEGGPSGCPCERVVCIPERSICMPLNPDLWHVKQVSAAPGLDVGESRANQFFLCLATCHTASPEDGSGVQKKKVQSKRRDDDAETPTEGLLTDPFLEGMSAVERERRQSLVAEASTTMYNSQSPDEEALLDMARDYGFFFRSRVGQNIQVNVRGEDRVYAVVLCNEFSSDRKRMSVLLRQLSKDEAHCHSIGDWSEGSEQPVLPGPSTSGCESMSWLPDTGGRYILFAKGADSVMLGRLRHQPGPFSESSPPTSAAHLESFECQPPSTVTPRHPPDQPARVLLRGDSDDASLSIPGIPDSSDSLRGGPHGSHMLIAEPLGARLIRANTGSASNVSGLSQGGHAKHEEIKLVLRRFACHGLRALVCAQRELSDHDAKEFVLKMKEAQGSFMNREKMEQEVMDELERDFEFLGVSAVEDKIQDGVPETVSMLLQGGMKVWMLTGDSMETAMNTALACRLGDSSCIQFVLDADSLSRADLLELMERYYYDIAVMLQENPQSKYCLAVHGQALYTILEEEEDSEKLRQLFVLIACSSRFVVACRLAPAQKAALVELVRNSLEGNPLILAIGDGGNDVSMIQKANVGVGILGVEGREAANSADFFIGQFRFLRSLLFVHGRWNLRKISIVIGYSFYKNFLLVVPMACYNLVAGLTGTILYDSYLLMMYNLVFTNLPIFIVGIFDVDVYASAALSVPELYLLGIGRTYFNYKVLLSWLLRGILHALFNFTVTFLVMGGSIPGSQGAMPEYLSSGSWSYWSCVLVANVTLLLNSQIVMDWQLCVIGASMLVFVPILYIYSTPEMANLVNPSMVGVAGHVMDSLPGWVALLLVLALSALGEFALASWRRLRSPDLVSRIQAFQVKEHLLSNEQLSEHSGQERRDSDYQRNSATAAVDVAPTPRKQLAGTQAGIARLMQRSLRGLKPPIQRKLQFQRGFYEPFQVEGNGSPDFQQVPFRVNRITSLGSDTVHRWWKQKYLSLTQWHWREMPLMRDDSSSAKTGPQADGAASNDGQLQRSGSRYVLSSVAFKEFPRQRPGPTGSRNPGAIGTVSIAMTNMKSEASRAARSHSNKTGSSSSPSKSQEFRYSILTLRFQSNSNECSFQQKFGDEAALNFKWAIRTLALIVSCFQATRLFSFSFSTTNVLDVVLSLVLLFGFPLMGEVVALPLWISRMRTKPEDYLTVMAVLAVMGFQVLKILLLRSASGEICGIYLPLAVAAGARIRFLRITSLVVLHNVLLLLGSWLNFGIETCGFDQEMGENCGFLSGYIIVQQFAVTILVIFYAYQAERFARQRFARDTASEAMRSQDMDLLQGMFPEEVVTHIVKSFGQRRHKEGGSEGLESNERRVSSKHACQDQGVVTVLFCDICDFENLVATLQPTELVQLLDRAFMMFDRICESNQVTKIETVGKTFMAAGMSCSKELSGEAGITADARNTFLSAAHILKKVARSALGIQSVSKITVKIGLHTGPVISGVVGSQKPQFALFGDTVNTAARMCSTGKVSHVHVSDSTFEYVGQDPRFRWDDRKTEVKGKDTMETHLLHNTYSFADVYNQRSRKSNAMLTRKSEGGSGVGQSGSLSSGRSSSRQHLHLHQPGQAAHIDLLSPSGSQGGWAPLSEEVLEVPHCLSYELEEDELSGMPASLVGGPEKAPAEPKDKVAVLPPEAPEEVPPLLMAEERYKFSLVATAELLAYGAEAVQEAFKWCGEVAVQESTNPDTVRPFITFWAFFTIESICVVLSRQGVSASRRDILVAVRSSYSVASLLGIMLFIKCARARKRRGDRVTLRISPSTVLPTPAGEQPYSAESRARMINMAVAAFKQRRAADNFIAARRSDEEPSTSRFMKFVHRNSHSSLSSSSMLPPTRDCGLRSRFTACIVVTLAGYICTVLSNVYGLMNSSYEEVRLVVYFESLFFNCVLLHFCMLRVTMASVCASVLMLVVSIGLGASTMGEWSPYALYPFAQYMVQLRLIYGMKAYKLRSLTALQMMQDECAKMEQLLNSLLPDEVLMEMKTDSLSLAYSYRNMTLLFADIVGFTRYCAQHSATEAVNLVTHLFAEFDDVSKILGVYKVCTIGDAYVAVNEPKTEHNDKVSGCYSVMCLAQAMLSIIVNVRKKVSHIGLDMRIGLHHGSFVAGIIGTNRLRFDIWGEDVLIGNNIESDGVPGKVCVSKEVKDVLVLFEEFAFSLHRDIILKSGRRVSSYISETTSQFFW